MDQAFSEALATNVWKLFPFRSGNRVWVIILLKAYFCCVILGFCLACILNACEGSKWLSTTIRGGWGVKARGDSALDECFWFVFTTMHGIGFGEFNARGVTGRLIAMFCCTIGYWFTIFMMAIIMLSQLPGEKVPSLYGVVSRMFAALWPSYSVFLAIILAVGAVVGPYVSKDHEGRNEWPTEMYWAWTVVHRTPYGDIFPDTVFGRFVTVPIGCMGVLYMPYALACIAVRCPSLAEHREIVGHLRGNPEDALGRGYVEPPEAASNGSLADFVMHDSYFKDEDGDRGSRGRSCIAVCVLLSFALIAMVFFGGSPQEVEKIVEHTLELDLPPGLRSSEDPVPPVVWTFWMHEYPLEGAGAEVFNSLGLTLDVDVQLVTPDILEQYNVTEEPFHPAMKYLAPNHKLDYLHAYFAHNYGGGYLEIVKRKDNTTWTKPFDYVGDNESRWFLGTSSAEEVTCDESNIEDAWCKELQFKTDGITYADTRGGMSNWIPSKGPCCAQVRKYYNHTNLWPRQDGIIVRKKTKFTTDWLNYVHQHLDAKMPALKMQTPPAEPCCLKHQESYPIRWDELRGEIWSNLLMKYKDHIRYDDKLV
jgi:hypothetical protein